ncbi:MAG TPA: hypothetical protein VGJ00_03055 [Rhabdochlamydiaceae bacterium]|jgi:hypothetical protein
MTFKYSAEHRGFYREGKAFVPKIQGNIAAIGLCGSLKEDLEWSCERVLAQSAVESGKDILWEIDFCFSSSGLKPRDSATFFAHVRALEECVRLISTFSAQTFGLCLFCGDVHFSSLFEGYGWEETLRDRLEELAAVSKEAAELLPRPIEEWGRYVRLFYADLLAEYLHRLVSFLPDGLIPFAFFDARGGESAAFLTQLFSPVRFQHLCLSLATDAPPLAICFPSDAYCTQEILSTLDLCMQTLTAEHIPFRIIFEDKLTEEWDGLDKLIAISEGLSPQGKRKLQGFCAAGGEIAYATQDCCFSSLFE